MLILSFCEPWSKGITGRQDPSDPKRGETDTKLSLICLHDYFSRPCVEKNPQRKIHSRRAWERSHIQPPSEAQTQLPVPVVTERHSAPLLIRSGCSQDQGAVSALPRCLTGTELCSTYVLPALCKLRMCSQGKDIKEKADVRAWEESWIVIL